MNRSTPGLPVHHQLLEFTQAHVHRVSDAIQPSHSLSSLLFLPSVFPSIRIFSNELALHIRWPKYWSFSFSNSPCNEFSGFTSFRIDWISLQSKGLSRESSLAPQFNGISSSVLSFFYCTAPTCVHDYWKNHSFDGEDLCRQNNVSAF